MIKKYISYLGVLVLACFSFYYTDRAVDIVKRNDPIMKSIISNSSKYYIEAVNAYTYEDEIVPGIEGRKVNENKSYQNMKKYNVYDESMLVFSDVLPDISFINNYNKYIVGGNELKNNVALIFKIVDYSYVNSLIKIINEKDIGATLFIDGTIIEEYLDDISNLGDYEIENLGYDLEYDKYKIGWTNNLITSITNNEPKYCYTDYKNDNIIELCSKNNMYTIKPSICVSSYPFSTVKNNVKNGSIISFNINSDVLKELSTIISYLKQKGYNLVTLNELINEKYIEEK